MRFISKFPQLGLGTARTEKYLLALDGQRDITTESLPITFTQTYLGQRDVDLALAHWPERSFAGRWLDADGVTQQPVAERIGVFDTEEEQRRNNWSDEERELVERKLLHSDSLGVDFIQATADALPAPWPTYDQMHHVKIADFAVEAGQVHQALAYERENKNRPSVVAALEDKIGETAAVVTA